MQAKTLRDVAAGALVLAALGLPLAHLLGDGMARMQVRFRTTEMAKPRTFTTETSSSVCTVMAAALAYEDPGTGTFTQVDCSARE
jgi:hypothetical protein